MVVPRKYLLFYSLLPSSRVLCAGIYISNYLITYAICTVILQMSDIRVLSLLICMSMIGLNTKLMLSKQDEIMPHKRELLTTYLCHPFHVVT